MFRYRMEHLSSNRYIKVYCINFTWTAIKFLNYVKHVAPAATARLTTSASLLQAVRPLTPSYRQHFCSQLSIQLNS
jgi:hypothetical protein